MSLNRVGAVYWLEGGSFPVDLGLFVHKRRVEG
jgi:hypothetical protein